MHEHLIGGVGDKVSLTRVPIPATRGANVQIISGRGHGHTGGTLDTMDSIPGYRTASSSELLRAAARGSRCWLRRRRPDAELAPADRPASCDPRRHRHGESIPLITDMHEGLGEWPVPCRFVGQAADRAAAARRLYAIRDVIATVEPGNRSWMRSAVPLSVRQARVNAAAPKAPARLWTA